MTTDNSKKAKINEFTMDEEMKNINLEKEKLKPFEPDTDFISMIQKFKDILNNKDSDWTLQISIINYLRRIFKFEKKVFSQFFYGAKFYQKILELIDSVRSSLAKNVLILLNEIFSEPMPQKEGEEEKKNNTTSSLITLIKETIPHLISKINSNKSFIKADSNICLESIIKNMKYFDVLLIIMQLMNTKKPKDAELLAELSVKMIKNLGKDFFVQNAQFNELMKCVVAFYESQKIVNVKKCKDILECFIEVMGKEDFELKVEKCSKKEKADIKIIMETKVVENKKKSSTKSSLHFRKDIIERKKSFRLAKCQQLKGNKSLTIKLVINDKSTTINAPGVIKPNDENIPKNY